MRKFYRILLFTKKPLNGTFRYRDIFQVLPVISENAPQSPYSRHYPVFLDFSVDFKNKDHLKIIDNPIALIKLMQTNIYEYSNLLTVFSNYRFFQYKSHQYQWGISSPNKDVKYLTELESNELNSQTSSWTICSYVYPGLKSDLEIDKFNDYNLLEVKMVDDIFNYYGKDPYAEDSEEISFPSTISYCLDKYFELSNKTQEKVKSCIGLICDGIDIFEFKKTIAFISFVSAIEGMTSLEFNDKAIEFSCHNCKTLKSSDYKCVVCGSPIWGVKTKFKEFLKKFAAGSEKSVKKYNKIYNARCKIAHKSQLFLSDYDMFLDSLEKQNEDYYMIAETLQLGRLSLQNWLRYPDKASR